MDNATNHQDGQEALTSLAGKYLTFRLGEEDYGLEILKVQEIIGLQEITTIPRTPAAFRGVINLRGKVIPVVDLRQKFAMETAAASRKTCIIVVQISAGTDGNRIMGVIVDEVSEVLTIGSEEIEPPPDFGPGIETGFILAMAKTRGGVKLLLDLDRVLTGDELAAVAESA